MEVGPIFPVTRTGASRIRGCYPRVHATTRSPQRAGHPSAWSSGRRPSATTGVAVADGPAGEPGWSGAGPEELSHVGGQEIGRLEGGGVCAAGEPRPVDHVAER